MLTEQTQRVRDYGGWRRRRGIGMLGLGPTSTAAVLAAVGALLLVLAANPALALLAGPPVGAVIGLAVARISGESLGALALRRMRWQIASARGHTKYRQAVVTEEAGELSLPGVLAPLALVSAEDGHGGHYGLVWDRRTGFLTATLRVVPTSTWLAERAEADGWVANWGAWLASLGHVPMVRWVTVTVETAPEPGSTLADTVNATIDPAAPIAAREILTQLVQAAPVAAADVDTRVSITFDPKNAPVPPRDLTEAVAEVGRALIGLESGLGGCGAIVAGRLYAGEIAGVVRTAFDPAARGEIERIAMRGSVTIGGDHLDWADAGPVGADEHPDRYRHDSGVSVTWAWQEAPRQNVTSDVLARLLAPGPFPKRVSLQYRPFPAAVAARVLENEVNAAAFRAHYRRRTGRNETARDAFDQARARQAATEEAAGSGVCLISLYATATVASDEELPRAVAWMEAAAESSKIRLRRMTYSQAAGFAASLPCGICPADLARRMPH